MIINILIGLMCLILLNIYIYPEKEKNFFIKDKKTLVTNVLSFLIIIAMAYYYESPGTFIAFLSLFIILLMASLIDYKTLMIPNEIVLLGLALGLVTVWINPMVSLQESLIGFLALGVGMALISFVSKENIGYGDAKLISIIGLLLGWKIGLVTAFIAFAFSALVGLFLLTFKIKGRKEMLPFAPFLLISFVVIIMI